MNVYATEAGNSIAIHIENLACLTTIVAGLPTTDNAEVVIPWIE